MTFRSSNFSRSFVWPFYTLVALMVLAPLLGRGFVLTLDMVFTPQLRMPASVGSSFLLRALLHGLNFILPGDVVEKLLLFTIFVLIGTGMHKLTESVQRTVNSTQSDSDKKLFTVYRLLSTVPVFFAGIFYVINPYTYDRLMAGQYNVLFGYALLPWFTRALLQSLRAPAWRTSVMLAAWAVALSIVSIHALGFMFLLAIAGCGFIAWRQKSDKIWFGKFWKFGLVSIGIFLAASSYWLVPLLLGHGNTATEISGFNSTDRAAFATVGGGWVGRFGNVLLLQGFWAEGTDMYNLPQDQVPGWFFLGAAIWLLVVLGGVRLWRTRHRTDLAIFGSVGLVAGILAAGAFNNWLALHVPFFAGYREPQKFVALVALAFSLFAGQGVAAIIQFTAYVSGVVAAKRKTLATCYVLFATFLLLALPFLWTPTMLWGANNQLAPAWYPADWFAANTRLDADTSNFKVLFLPWHEYMSFGFEGRIIANPAPQFFDKPVVVSDDPEFGDISSPKHAEASLIGAVLASAGSRQDLARRLAPYHIKYIILALDDDYTNYNYLQRQPGLQRISKSATLELYRNKLVGD